MRYTHDTWSIDLPDDWTVEETDECLTLFNPDGVGAIQISTYVKETGNVTHEDLLEFAEVENPGKVDFPHLKGIQKTLVDSENVFIKWWLRSGPQLFYVTYICEEGDELIEAEEREYVLHSLRPHDLQ